MRLCFICCEYPPGPHGGVGTMVQLLGRALARAGHEVRVIGIYPPSYPADDYEVDQGVRVWRLRQPKRKFGWITAQHKMFQMVKQWAKAGEIELAEAPDSRGWFAAWPKLNIPLVQRSNGSYSYFARDLNKQVDRMTYWLEKRSYLRSDAWTSVSRYTADVTRDVFRLRTQPRRILYNPVELHRQAEQFDSRCQAKVVFTGTLVKKKGIISLIDAWPKVVNRHPGAELFVYGKEGRTPDQQPMIEFLLRERLPQAMHGTVHFCGHVPRDTLFEALSTARAAVFPSYSEAFAFAPLESMSLGCPTIYSTRGSGPELIRNGQDGLLVDPDSPAEIADSLLAILGDDQYARELGEQGQVRAREFTVESLLPANEEFFADVIAEHGK